MNTEPTTCPICVADFPSMSAAQHDHLMRLPEWTAAEVMAFVASTYEQVFNGPAEGVLPVDGDRASCDLECWGELHLDEGTISHEFIATLAWLASHAKHSLESARAASAARSTRAATQTGAVAAATSLVDTLTATRDELREVHRGLQGIADTATLAEIERREFGGES